MSKRILIVDDDLETVKLIGLMLQRRGYEVISAYAGDQALAAAEAEKPDLVILDVMMPDMDGYEVCHQLRSNPNTAFVPVIMFTAKALVGDKVAGFQAGADDYLTKPIHPSDLVSRVEAMLQRAEQTAADPQRMPRARIIGVLGAKGGVGASTLAVNLAAATAQAYGGGSGQNEHGQVGIVDVRPGLGTVSLLLGEGPEGSWGALMARSADSLDPDTIEAQTLTHASGLRYLPTSLQPDEKRPTLSPHHVDVVVNHLAAGVDYLFLDLGSILDEATSHAMAFCDAVVVVVEPEILCLKLAKALLGRIRTLDSGPGDVHFVLVQRHENDATYTHEEVEELLGEKLIGVIESAPVNARQAVEQGQPLVNLYPGSEIAGQFRELSRKLVA